MKRLALFAFLLAPSLPAAEKPAPTKVVFAVSGLECGGCVYMVQNQLSQTPGITAVEVMQGLDGTAEVAYDPKALSEHQVAQAVRDAPGLHGTPYLASLKLRIPGLSAKADQVKALFEKWKPWIAMTVWDAQAGEVIVHFHELKQDTQGAVPKGWSFTQLAEDLRPMGMTCEILRPGEP